MLSRGEIAMQMCRIKRGIRANIKTEWAVDESLCLASMTPYIREGELRTRTSKSERENWNIYIHPVLGNNNNLMSTTKPENNIKAESTLCSALLARKSRTWAEPDEKLSKSIHDLGYFVKSCTIFCSLLCPVLCVCEKSAIRAFSIDSCTSS